MSPFLPIPVSPRLGVSCLSISASLLLLIPLSPHSFFNVSPTQWPQSLKGRVTPSPCLFFSHPPSPHLVFSISPQHLISLSPNLRISLFPHLFSTASPPLSIPPSFFLSISLSLPIPPSPHLVLCFPISVSPTQWPQSLKGRVTPSPRLFLSLPFAQSTRFRTFLPNF